MAGDSFTKSGFLALAWTLATAALCLFIMRLIIRRRIFGKFMIDDYLVLLAGVCLFANIIAETVKVDLIFYVQEKIESDVPRKSFAKASTEYFKLQWGIAYVYFTTLWAIKGSFLAYYDGLTNRLPKYRRFWWATIVLTILTYIGALLAYALLNGLQIAHNFQNKAIDYQFSADLTTDVLITALPLTLALRSQLPLRQKLALTGVFSLSLLITIIAIIRFSLNRGVVLPTWITGWSLIEQGVSVCIACLVSFRSLAVSERKGTKKSYEARKYTPGSESSGPRRGSTKRTVFGFTQLGSDERDEPQGRQQQSSMDIELLTSSRPTTSHTPDVEVDNRIYATAGDVV